MYLNKICYKKITRNEATISLFIFNNENKILKKTISINLSFVVNNNVLEQKSARKNA